MKNKYITIGNKKIRTGLPCLIVAEVAQAHDGSLGTAHAYIDAAAEAGADAVKFQTHIADAESSPAEPFRVNFSYQDATRYEYWKRIEFTPTQWSALAKHADERGLIFLSSAFSEPAVELLERIGVPAWKVASGEIETKPLLKKMGETGKPLLLSTGLASWQQIDQAVSWFEEWNAPYALLQCTTAYPCLPEQWGLNVLGELRERYGCPVGYSDHSGCIAAGLAATTFGANLIEVHIVFSRDCFGPDVLASLTLKELKQLVEGVRAIEKALWNPVDKNAYADDSRDTLRLFSKSIVASRNLQGGTRLELQDITFRKPGHGIPAKDYEKLIGRRLKRSVACNDFIAEADIE